MILQFKYFLLLVITQFIFSATDSTKVSRTEDVTFYPPFDKLEKVEKKNLYKNKTINKLVYDIRVRNIINVPKSYDAKKNFSYKNCLITPETSINDKKNIKTNKNVYQCSFDDAINIILNIDQIIGPDDSSKFVENYSNLYNDFKEHKYIRLLLMENLFTKKDESPIEIIICNLDEKILIIEHFLNTNCDVKILQTIYSTLYNSHESCNLYKCATELFPNFLNFLKKFKTDQDRCNFFIKNKIFTSNNIYLCEIFLDEPFYLGHTLNTIHKALNLGIEQFHMEMVGKSMPSTNAINMTQYYTYLINKNINYLELIVNQLDNVQSKAKPAEYYLRQVYDMDFFINMILELQLKDEKLSNLVKSTIRYIKDLASKFILPELDKLKINCPFLENKIPEELIKEGPQYFLMWLGISLCDIKTIYTQYGKLSKFSIKTSNIGHIANHVDKHITDGKESSAKSTYNSIFKFHKSTALHSFEFIYNLLLGKFPIEYIYKEKSTDMDNGFLILITRIKDSNGYIKPIIGTCNSLDETDMEEYAKIVLLKSLIGYRIITFYPITQEQYNFIPKNDYMFVFKKEYNEITLKEYYQNIANEYNTGNLFNPKSALTQTILKEMLNKTYLNNLNDIDHFTIKTHHNQKQKKTEGKEIINSILSDTIMPYLIRSSNPINQRLRKKLKPRKEEHYRLDMDIDNIFNEPEAE